MVCSLFNPTYSNEPRTEMSFRIHLSSTLGAGYDSKKKYIRLKMVQISSLHMQSATQIDHTDNGALRTSNVWLRSSELPFSNRGEVLLGQATNYDPEQEKTIYTTFNRADSGVPSRITFLTNTATNNPINTMRDLVVTYALVYPDAEPFNTSWWRWNSNPINAIPFQNTTPPMENQLVQFGRILAGGPPDGNSFQFSFINPYGDTMILKEDNSTGIANYPITLTSVPAPGEWFPFTGGYSCRVEGSELHEVWFHNPRNGYLDFTIQLRDLLTDMLQPVLTTTKQFPVFQFKFDLEAF